MMRDVGRDPRHVERASVSALRRHPDDSSLVSPPAIRQHKTLDGDAGALAGKTRLALNRVR
jgi:hypothetical protein